MTAIHEIINRYVRDTDLIDGYRLPDEIVFERKLPFKLVERIVSACKPKHKMWMNIK